MGQVGCRQDADSESRTGHGKQVSRGLHCGMLDFAPPPAPGQRSLGGWQGGVLARASQAWPPSPVRRDGGGLFQSRGAAQRDATSCWRHGCLACLPEMARCAASAERWPRTSPLPPLQRFSRCRSGACRGRGPSTKGRGRVEGIGRNGGKGMARYGTTAGRTVLGVHALPGSDKSKRIR